MIFFNRNHYRHTPKDRRPLLRQNPRFQDQKNPFLLHQIFFSGASSGTSPSL